MKKALSAALLVFAAGQASAQLVIGLDGPQDEVVYNPSTNTFPLAFPHGTVGIRALAADSVNRRLYFSTGTDLYRQSFDPPYTSELVAAFSGAVTTISSGMAFANGVLYATQGTGTTHRLYTVDTSTGVTTLLRSFNTGDFGGLDYNAADGKLYATNDSTSTTNGFAGRGIYTIDPPFDTGAITRIAPYPGSETDIDGCAVNGNFVYACRDLQNYRFWIYDIAAGTYSAAIENGTSTTSEVFNGATWAEGIFVQLPGSNVGISVTDPADCTVIIGQQFDYTVNVSNSGPDQATGAMATLTLPPQVSFVSATGGATHNAGVVMAALGSIDANGSTSFTVTVQLNSGGTLDASASVTVTSDDPVLENNAATASLLVPNVGGNASIKGVLSTIASSPTSTIPEIAGTISSTGGLDRPVVSPNGQYWMLAVDTTLPDTSDNVLLRGLTATASYEAVAQEGLATPDVGDLLGEFDINTSINDLGQFVFSTNTSATANDEIVQKWDGSQFTVVAREGTGGPSSVPGSSWGATSGSVHIGTTGQVGLASTLTGTPGGAADDGVWVLNGGEVLVAQEFVTIPGNQAGFPFETYDILDFGTIESSGIFWSADQSDYIASGSLANDTTRDEVAVYNGDVVIQEGSILAGSDFTSPADDVDPINFVGITATGDWLAYGDNIDGQDWALFNGNVIARTDAPITPGNTEVWGDSSFAQTFFLAVGNNRGDHVVGGVTSAADDLANAVLVFNGDTVIARENDPIDLDNNGVFDDDVYLRTFRDDRAFMTDTEVWIVVRARNLNGYCTGADTEIGQLLVRIPLPNTCGWQQDGCYADYNNDGGIDGDDVIAFFGAWDASAACADVDASDGVDGDDVIVFFASWDVSGTGFPGC